MTVILYDMTFFFVSHRNINRIYIIYKQHAEFIIHKCTIYKGYHLSIKHKEIDFRMYNNSSNSLHPRLFVRVCVQILRKILPPNKCVLLFICTCIYLPRGVMFRKFVSLIKLVLYTFGLVTYPRNAYEITISCQTMHFLPNSYN